MLITTDTVHNVSVAYPGGVPFLIFKRKKVHIGNACLRLHHNGRKNQNLLYKPHTVPDYSLLRSLA